jgi:peptidylprolyl isomerase
MFSRFEVLVGGLCVVAMATALYLVRADATTNTIATTAGSLVNEEQVAGLVFVTDDERTPEVRRAEALLEATDNTNRIQRMVVEDIVVGEGDEVQSGDTVVVHYAGRLQSGEEFDNSQRRGQPFSFTVGAGQVIKGWEEGLIGMKVGGERVLVIPPDKGYGAAGIGPIPPNATLVFSIQLLDIE